MLSPQMVLPLANELVVDLFAGGGGTSTGLERALGRYVDIAVNHDPEAVAMHRANHPQTTHYVCDVYEVNPVEVTNGRRVGLLWASPDCTFHSKARGGKPFRDRNRARRRRGLAGVVVRWAALPVNVRPRVILLENVEEFQHWGPLQDDGTPCPERRGQSFNRWLARLKNLGYVVEWRELRACDYGAPTIRKRLFLVARCDGLPIVWPDPTHGAPDNLPVRRKKLKSWRTAAECIDFDLPANSIFDREKPLVINTQRRVAKGLWRHVLTSAKPFIVNTRNGEREGQEPRVRDINAPMWTVTAQGSQGAIASPVLAPFINEHANASNQRTMPADEPLRTVCAQVKGGHFSLVAPLMAPLRGTSDAHLGAHDVLQPLSTVSAQGTHHALACAHLTHLTHHGERSGHPVDQPLATITGAHRGEQAMVTAFMTKYRTGSVGHGLDEPMHTITANSFVNRPGGSVPMGLVAASFLEQANGGFYAGEGRAMDAPMSTITTAGSNQQLVTAYCVEYRGDEQTLSGNKASSKDHGADVQAVQVSIDCLALEHRDRARQCAELLHQHLPAHFPEPAQMIVMQIGAHWWVLVDITLRMLTPRELYRAQGFPDNYIISHDDDGRPFTKTAQIRMCGNSVSPAMSYALARANYVDVSAMNKVAA